MYGWMLGGMVDLDFNPQKRMTPEYDELIKNTYTSGCIQLITYIQFNASKMDGYRRRE